MGDEGVRAVGVQGAGHSRNWSFPGAGDLVGDGEEAGVRWGVVGEDGVGCSAWRDVRSRELAARVGTGGCA